MKRSGIIVTILLLLSISSINSCSLDSDNPWSQQETRSITLTTIAVVNEDMGIEIGSERHNYSAAIINALDEEFTLVSPTMADSGYESGAYGAVITFPADVSEKILSFNSSRPERVQIEFKVNPNLSEADYVDTYLKIMNLQISINTTLAYTYVSSIYIQFHMAQDHLELVFRNNLDNLSSIDIIRLPAFSSLLNLDELPDIPLEIMGTDTAQHVISVNDFAENVSIVYLSSYAEASQQYLSMREGLFEMVDALPEQEDEWMDKLAAWAMIKVGYSDDITVFAEALEDYAGELQAWLDSLREWHEEAADWHGVHKLFFDESIRYFKDMSDYTDCLIDSIAPALDELQDLYDLLEPSLEMLHIWHDAMEPAYDELRVWYDAIEPSIEMLQVWQSGLTAAMGTLQTWQDNLNAYIITLCANCESCIGCATIPPPGAGPGFSIPQLDAGFYLPELDDDFKVLELDEDFNIPDTDEFSLPTIEELLGEAPPGSLPDLPDELELRVPPAENPSFSELRPARPTELQPPRPDDFWDSVNHLYTRLTDFDVGAFLSDDVHQQVIGFLNSYEAFLSMLSDDMDMQFDMNLLELYDVRYGYIEYLASLKADTLQGEANEQERLRSDLDEVISRNESNNDNTHTRLSDFAGMMPESRTQAGMNRDLIDFTVAPFKFVSPEVRQALLTVETEREIPESSNHRGIIIVTTAALLVLLTVTAIIIRRRAKKRIEEGLGE